MIGTLVRNSAILLLLAAMPPLSGIAGEAGPDVRWVNENGAYHVEVTGLDFATLMALDLPPDPKAPGRLLAVSVQHDGKPGRPMSGTYRTAPGKLLFRPRYPLEAGLTYVATLTLPKSATDGKSATISRPITLREAESRPTEIVRLDPSGGVVPENLLKLYLTFSAPMSRGQAYRRVHVVGPDGKPLELPFLEIGEELWDPSQTRLTLLFDPGRIKNGLRPREEEGPILEAGKTYTIVVDAAWPDAAGKPLVRGLEKTLRAEGADLKSPNPGTWTLSQPRVGTREGLGVDFGESLDHALAARLLSVVDAKRLPVAGRSELDEESKFWRFVPERPWAGGEYHLVVPRQLEDLAGNSVGRPFEVDTFQVDSPAHKPEPVELPFTTVPSPP